MIVLALVLTACGGGNGTQPTVANPTQGNTGGNGTTPPPGDKGGTTNQGTCSFQGWATGVKVYYAGTQGAGTQFPSTTTSYTGTIQTLISTSGGWIAEVAWGGSVGTNFQYLTVLRTLGSCTPDITNRRVIYNGSATTLFPNAPTTVYAGYVKAVYAEGFAEVQWDHLGTTTYVLPFSKIWLANN